MRTQGKAQKVHKSAQSLEGAHASRMARGSVFRKNGGWAFRVDAGFHAETGKRRQLLRQGFGTKRAAEEALAEAVGAATRGTHSYAVEREIPSSAETSATV